MQIISGLDNDHTVEIQDRLETAYNQLNRVCQLLLQADQDNKREKELCLYAGEACDQVQNARAALDIIQRHYDECVEEIRAGV